MAPSTATQCIHKWFDWPTFTCNALLKLPEKNFWQVFNIYVFTSGQQELVLRYFKILFHSNAFERRYLIISSELKNSMKLKNNSFFV